MPITPVEPELRSAQHAGASAPSAPLASSAPPATPHSSAPSFGRAIATVGRVRRAGRWLLPPRFRAVAWMGGVELDLTEAVIPPDGAVLKLLAVLGVVTVRVPAELHVELMGNDVSWSADSHWTPVRGSGELTGRATVRLVGRTVLGRIHVHAVGTSREQETSGDTQG